jgi:ABC-2 type transport system ATP-binding protein/lipopolysaccharide transport system ATP-binding protein
MSSISLKDVTVRFPLDKGGSRSLKKSLLMLGGTNSLSRHNSRIVVDALKNVSFQIDHGERIGLVGSNGAGKTTLLRAIAGVYEPVIGSIEVNGDVSALLNAGLGLNQDATGYENIHLRGLFMGLHPREIRRLTPQIAEFTELGEFLHMPVRTYSAGMVLRLAFATATATTPDILLMDEWLLAGDAQFLEKARRRVDTFVTQSQILILASHSTEILSRWCTRLFWLDHGRIVMEGDTEQVLKQYRSGVLPKGFSTKA